MPVYSLLGQTGVPDHLDAFTGQLVNGTEFTTSVASVLSGIWMYSFTGAGQLPSEVGLYVAPAGTLVFSDPAPSWSGAAGSGWVKYTSSQAIAAGSYVVAAGNGAGGQTWYAITNSGWGPVTNGPMSCTSNPNSFSTSGSFSYPNTTYGANNIWLDAEITVAGPPPALPPLIISQYSGLY